MTITEPGYESTEALVAHLESLGSSTARHRALVSGFTDLLVGSRAEAALIAHDPAVRGQEPYVSRNAELREKLLVAVYGPALDHDARFATFAAVALTEAIALSPGLSDDELREVLTRLLTRMFPAPDDML